MSRSLFTDKYDAAAAMSVYDLPAMNSTKSFESWKVLQPLHLQKSLMRL